MKFVWRLVLAAFLVSIVAVPTSGCAGKNKKKKDARLAALKGDDIPLSGRPEDWQFVEPSDPLIFSDIQFDYNSSVIRQDARPQLEKIAEWLQGRRNTALMVEGHCDERGSKEYNLALGEQRALAVRKYLVGIGVNADRVYTVSYGEEKPISSGRGEDNWARNRRAHFLVTQ